MTEQTSKQTLSDAELEAVVGGVGVGVVHAGYGLMPTGLEGLDIEAAMMAVQGQRASLLEGQLAEQIQAVEQRNALVGALSDGRDGLEQLMGRMEAGESITAEEGQAIIDALKAHLGGSDERILDSDQDGLISKSEAEDMISVLQGRINEETSNQQMDMLRLQSLSNKRNEAFDVMTNFIKKMQDSRSSIIGNMR